MSSRDRVIVGSMEWRPMAAGRYAPLLTGDRGEAAPSRRNCAWVSWRRWCTALEWLAGVITLAQNSKPGFV